MMADNDPLTPGRWVTWVTALAVLAIVAMNAAVMLLIIIAGGR